MLAEVCAERYRYTTRLLVIRLFAYFFLKGVRHRNAGIDGERDFLDSLQAVGVMKKSVDLF